MLIASRSLENWPRNVVRSWVVSVASCCTWETARSSKLSLALWKLSTPTITAGNTAAATNISVRWTPKRSLIRFTTFILHSSKTIRSSVKLHSPGLIAVDSVDRQSPGYKRVIRGVCIGIQPVVHARTLM